MKKQLTSIILFFGLLLGSSSFSQSVSVELAIEWELEKVYLKDSSLSEDKPIPYLVITYRNLSKERLYLKKLFSNDEFYLPNGNDTPMCTNLQYDEIAMRILDGSRKKEKSYIYSIRESFVDYDTLNKNIEYTSAAANSRLFIFYSVFDLQRQLNNKKTGKQLRCFSYPDKDYVNPKEIKQQKLCLIGMMLIGGTFAFTIDDLDILIPNSLDSLKQEGTVINKEEILTNESKYSCSYGVFYFGYIN